MIAKKRRDPSSISKVAASIPDILPLVTSYMNELDFPIQTATFCPTFSAKIC